MWWTILRTRPRRLHNFGQNDLFNFHGFTAPLPSSRFGEATLLVENVIKRHCVPTLSSVHRCPPVEATGSSYHILHREKQKQRHCAPTLSSVQPWLRSRSDSAGKTPMSRKDKGAWHSCDNTFRVDRPRRASKDTTTQFHIPCTSNPAPCSVCGQHLPCNSLFQL